MDQAKPYEKMMKDLRLQLHQAEDAFTAALGVVEKTKMELARLAVQHPELTYILSKEEERLAEVGREFSKDLIAAAKATLVSLEEEVKGICEKPESGLESEANRSGTKMDGRRPPTRDAEK